MEYPEKSPHNHKLDEAESGQDMRVWLHKWEGNEWGWNAWSLDHLGFATWAPSRSEVLGRVSRKFEEYQQWLAGHGVSPPDVNLNKVKVVEEISGDEPAFQHDLFPAAVEEISHCIQLLELTRSNLISLVEKLDDFALDWDPPYRHFASYAWWRTIRQIVEHIVLTEVGYYLPNVGWYAEFRPSELREIPWREQLRLSREETKCFLNELKSSRDKTRTSVADEVWSVRKVLRRLVWHERLHWKSIQRIVRDYYGQLSSSIY